MTYTGIKIIMSDGKGTEDDGSDKKIAYGISKINVNTGVYRLVFSDCEEN